MLLPTYETGWRVAIDVIGVLSVLDRRDGGAYGPSDLVRARLFADLVVAALRAGPGAS